MMDPGLKRSKPEVQNLKTRRPPLGIPADSAGVFSVWMPRAASTAFGRLGCQHEMRLQCGNLGTV